MFPSRRGPLGERTLPLRSSCHFSLLPGCFVVVNLKSVLFGSSTRIWGNKRVVVADGGNKPGLRASAESFLEAERNNYGSVMCPEQPPPCWSQRPPPITGTAGKRAATVFCRR
jgi:hypothetical protein